MKPDTFVHVILLAGLLVLTAVPNMSQSAIVRGFSLQELAREAHNVVIGTVEGARSFYNDDGSVIYTHYTVEVERSVKGLAPAIIEVRLMGGSVGDRELIVAGNPRIENGERVLLFLRDQLDFYTLVGMSQGKWSVREFDGRTMAFRGSVPQPPSVPQPIPSLLEGELPLSELLKLCGLE